MKSLLPLVLIACGPKATTPPAAASPAPVVEQAAQPEPVGGPWSHELYADHALVGRIWRASDGAFVDEATLIAALRDAEFRLLGEKHDNIDHHRLQARMIEALQPTGVAFEQIDDGDPVGEPTSAAELAESVAWSESGWPEFSMYEPVFSATLAAGAQVLPAHPTRDQLMGSARAGLESLGEAAEDLPLDRELDEAQNGSLEQEIVDSHCGHADPNTVHMMIGMQRLKDAWMARALVRHGAGAVLVAGNGHTRADRGVPHYLDGGAVTLAFREVDRDEDDPAAYEEPADFVWFTPRVEDVDPCEKFRESLQQMGHTDE